jgi:hypothetical protein
MCCASRTTWTSASPPDWVLPRARRPGFSPGSKACSSQTEPPPQMAGFLFLGTLKPHVRNRWLGKGAFMPSPHPQKLKRRAPFCSASLIKTAGQVPPSPAKTRRVLCPPGAPQPRCRLSRGLIRRGRCCEIRRSTRHASSRSPRIAPEFVQQIMALIKQGRGEGRALAAPVARLQKR